MKLNKMNLLSINVRIAQIQTSARALKSLDLGFEVSSSFSQGPCRRLNLYNLFYHFSFFNGSLSVIRSINLIFIIIYFDSRMLYKCLTHGYFATVADISPAVFGSVRFKLRVNSEIPEKRSRGLLFRGRR